jgi:restriction endonuclease S subunit
MKTNIEEIGELYRGVSYKKEDSSTVPSKDYLPIIRANNLDGKINFNELVYVKKDRIKTHQLVKKGDIIISMSSGSKSLVGKAARAEKDYDVSFGAFCSLLRVKDQVLSKFIFYLLRSNAFKDYIRKISTGTNINNLKREHILDFEFYLPELKMQDAIVAKIEELFSELENGVANLEKTKDQLQTYRQSVLKHAFEGRLTENWRAHNPAQSIHPVSETITTKAAEPQAVYQKTANEAEIHNIPQDTLENLPGPELLQYIKAERQRQYEQELKEWEQKAKAAKAKGQKKPAKPKKPKEMNPLTEEELQQLPELPEGWCWVKLGDISYLITKGASPKWQGFNYTQDNSQTLFITSENVRENFLDISNPKFLENSFNDKQKNSVLRKYDLLINIVGASIGRASVFKLNSLANINQAVSKVSLVNHEMAEFYSLYFNSKIANDIFNLKKVDVARANLSLHDINNIPVPLSSIKEQKQIVREIESRLSVANNLSESIDQSLQQAQSMRQSILKKAFEGKLVESEEEVEAEKA